MPAIVLLCAAAAADAVPPGRSRSARCPSSTSRSFPARERFGYYVDRRASGTDLYSAGRAAVLRTSAGSTLTAADHLTAVWHLARPDALAWTPLLSMRSWRARSRLPCGAGERADAPVAVTALGRPGANPTRPESRTFAGDTGRSASSRLPGPRGTSRLGAAPRPTAVSSTW